MSISLKPAHLKRYKDVCYLLIKYGRQDLVKCATANAQTLFAGLPDAGKENGNGNGNGHANYLSGDRSFGGDGDMQNKIANSIPLEELRSDLERLGPTFIEAGRWLASRFDLLPLPYLEALANLGKQAPAMEPELVHQTIESELRATMAATFSSFEDEPLSVSAIEQTHQCVLHGGKQVIVKVQRPDVREQIIDDIEAFEELSDLFDHRMRATQDIEFRGLVDEFSKTLLAELDYRQESHNLKALGGNLKDLPHLIVPQPLERYSTSKILMISYIKGVKLNEESCRWMLRGEKTRLAEEVFYAYLRQMLVDGFAHVRVDADNILITEGGKLALLDLGVVARITPAMQEKLIQLLLSITEGRADHIAELLTDIGKRQAAFDEEAFHRAVADLVLVNRDMSVEQIELGTIFRGFAQAAVRYGILLPSEVTTLGKVLLVIDQIAHSIDPKFDSHGFLHRQVSNMMHHHMRHALSPARMFHTILETTEFFERLPGKIISILDSLSSNQLAITVHAIDEQVLIRGFQKIANRITVGLVLASLIMGAALLMRVRTAFTIGGYPGLAMLCFLAAAACGFALVLEILISDVRDSRSH